MNKNLWDVLHAKNQYLKIKNQRILGVVTLFTVIMINAGNFLKVMRNAFSAKILNLLISALC